jgi:hypothetical protein
VSQIRFSLAGLLRVVTICAILCSFIVALRSGSNDSFKSFYTLTFTTLLYAAIAARYRGAFWYGFAIVGWAFFLVGFGPWAMGPHSSEGASNRNLSSSVVNEAVSGYLTFRVESANANIFGRELIRFNREGICHSALTIIFAIVGGAIAHRMARHATTPHRP